MADLTDPALPPGAIVATHEDDEGLEEGQVRRNDGVVLNPASKNPWYVLATVAGEQTGRHPWEIENDLHAQNRRFWNGWMCQNLSDEERTTLSEKLQLGVEDLAPLSEEEIAVLEMHFAEAFPDVAAEERLPDPESIVNLSGIHFPSPFVLGNAHFAAGASFQTAHFAGHADFRTAHFADTADFGTAHFAKFADFRTAHFAGHAHFMTAHFAEYADFGTAHFADTADFGTAHFAKFAYFETAHFAGLTSFSDGAFKAKTVFTRATFKTYVPAFFHREMHQNTSFSEDPGLWPKVTDQNAESGKKAYTRLRQVAAEVYDPDLEHFFLRQEMRCKEQVAVKNKDWFHAGVFTLFRWVADSGISVERPLWLMIIVWAFGVGCFAGYFDSGVEAVLSPEIQDNRYWSAAGVSFGNIFGFLGINRLYFTEMLRAAPDGLQAVAGAQTVLGVFLLFFFGLGLRNRFRLK